MKGFLSLLFLLISTISSAQIRDNQVIAKRAPDSKFQFINISTGLPVDKQVWDEVEPFVEGYARVLQNSKFSFVNKLGKLIAPVEFDEARDFSNRLVAVKKLDKWGFINEHGKTVIDFKYDIVFDFESSVTVVFDTKAWSLVNNEGTVIKTLDIDICYGFKNGKAKILKADKEGILNVQGDIIFTGKKNKSTIAPPYQPKSNIITESCPDNLDFEFGDFTNWQCYTGRVDSVGTTNVITVFPSPPTVNRHTIIPRTIPSAIDPFGLFPTNPPDGSNAAVRLGNTQVGAQAERIRYTIHVPLNDSNFSIVYDYAVVFQDPGHTTWTQPRFITRLLDSATNTYIDCASFEYISTSNLPDFAVSPVNSSVIYKPWASVFYNLRGHGGKTLYMEFTNADCVRTGHWGYAYIDVESICGNPIRAQYNCNPPNITTLTGPPGFQFYNWWDSGYTTILGTGRVITLNPGPSINTTIWLEMIPFSTFGCQDTLKITITGDLDGVFGMSDTTACAPHTFTFYNRNLPSLTTFWDFGDGNTGVGDTVTHTYSIPGTYFVQLTVTQQGGCTGTGTQKVVVLSGPTVLQPPNQTACNITVTSPVNFSGSTGTLYNWVNSNPTIGLPAVGSGNIPSFTALNPGNTPVTATITVTPYNYGCSGTPTLFTITVNPTPNVIQPVNQTLCNNTATNAINFSGNVAGANYSWVNSNPAIGLPAAGVGDIPSFIAINNGATAVTATISVTPSASGCTGVTRTFTITVRPTPNVIQPAEQAVCNGSNTNPVNFTGAINGTTYNWTNNNTSIGLGASGTGNIAAFTALNNSTVPVSATVTVTPSLNGCAGPPQAFIINVYPSPNIVQPASQVLCHGAVTNPVTFSSSITGASFDWSNNNPSIGLPATGSGNIPSFTVNNSGNTTTTATITVTPSAAGCLGVPVTFTYTVNPIPGIAQPANQVLCNGDLTTGYVFSSQVIGATFIWTNDNPSIGLAAIGTGNIPGFFVTNTGNTTQTATITVTPSAAGCPGLPQTFSITVNPTPTVVQPANQVLCNAASTNAITFNGAVSGSNFNWTNSNTSIGLAASGTGNIPVFTATNTGNTPQTATITVTPSAAGCPGLSQTFTITVNPTPNVAQPANQLLCNGDLTTGYVFSSQVSGATFIWTNDNPSIGLAAIGNGNIPGFFVTNTGNTTQTATITVTPSSAGCPGLPQTFTITVNPTPNVAQPVNQVLCNGASTNAITFNGAVSGSNFSWTNSNTSIGLAASGTGNIPAFTATNTGNSPQTATITVTPSASGCTGLPQIFTITVNPIPNVTRPADQDLCDGANTNIITFNGTVSGSTFNWTNNNTSIGLGASGTGDIPAFTATNTSNTTQTATITVTPSAAGCNGLPQTFTITVNPIPNVIQPANQILCSGFSTAAINFAGSVNNAIYTWTNTEPSIGLSGSGTGNIPPFTTVNVSNNPVVATITVTPTMGLCTGNPEIFTITVNPTPDVAPPADQTLCNGATN